MSSLLPAWDTASEKTCPLSAARLEDLAAEFGTPYQLFDEPAIRNNAKNLISQFSAKVPNFQQHFAVKALPNPAILKILMSEGCGLDCSSTSELHIAEKLGCPGAKVCYTSNFTSKADLAYALKQGATINLDDVSLIDTLAEAARDHFPVEYPNGFPELISFRLNPGVGRTDSKTVSNVLGGPNAKFGVAHFQIKEAYEKAKMYGAKRFGIHMMTGSCVMSNAYWVETVSRMLDTVAMLRKELHIEFEYINVGGGIGCPYEPGQVGVDIASLVTTMRETFDKKIAEHGMPEPTLHMENGRYMTGPFGYLVSRCEAVKNSYQVYFGLDSCMANLMRPGMYGSYHHITVPKYEEDGNGDTCERSPANVVGTLCENNDWFAKDRSLPSAAGKGDLFVIHDSGAHSHSMGFQYNGKLRAPEVLLRKDGHTVSLIRHRETIEGLYANCVDIDI
jgi:diaminopimelate decarboxylase